MLKSNVWVISCIYCRQMAVIDWGFFQGFSGGILGRDSRRDVSKSALLIRRCEDASRNSFHLAIVFCFQFALVFCFAWPIDGAIYRHFWKTFYYLFFFRFLWQAVGAESNHRNPHKGLRQQQETQTNVNELNLKWNSIQVFCYFNNWILKWFKQQPNRRHRRRRLPRTEITDVTVSSPSRWQDYLTRLVH